MSNLRKIVAVGIIGIVLVLGAVVYSVFRTPEAASSPIQAIPLDQGGSSATAAPAQPTAAPATEGAAAEPAATTAPAAEAPISAPADTAAADPAASSSSPITAQIVPEESEARFIIDEVLNGAPKTVVGTTNQVAGELAVDPADPTKSRVGIIQVNARTLSTDSDMRNRAIKNQILGTDQYEFITFTPTEIVGLPQSGDLGQSYTFQIVGDLTIRDVTRQVTFDVTATPASDSRLEGTAQTTIQYADYGIAIPKVRQVASVADTVRLEIDFVAVPK